MKKYKSIIDMMLLAGLAIISFVATIPEALVMPSSAEMIILLIVLSLLVAFLILFWREDPNDEREVQNQLSASRWAYMAGSGVLIIALIFQTINHKLDPIIPIALLAMIATKIIVQNSKNSK